MLHMGRNTSYELLKPQQITSIKIGRQIRISELVIIEYLTFPNKAKVK